MLSPTKYLEHAGKGFNVIACVAIIIMMMLSTADVVLRLFGKPIPGAYELIGFIGTVVVSFAVGFTSMEKGHIAVELLYRKLPQRTQLAIETFTNIVSFLVFGLITYQAFIYALDMRKSGEVSPTLQMPIYPFIFGMSFGFGLLCLILIADSIKSMKRTLNG
jgi:TRAP-type C4-dicarboxylate transport system permease small subunit